MLIGLISDIHDQEDNLHAALQHLKDAGCTRLIFLGDIATPATFRTLCAAWPHEIDLVLGNNDYPREQYMQPAEQQSHRIHCHGDEGSLLLDNRCIFITHDPFYAVHAIDTGKYHAVFFGHTHRAEQLELNGALVANPGDIQGRYGAPSCAVYETTTHTLKLIQL